jgi:hypothetical protein
MVKEGKTAMVGRDEGRRRYLSEDGDIEINNIHAPLGDTDQI